LPQVLVVRRVTVRTVEVFESTYDATTGPKRRRASI
jgi:hypothetical protein